MARKFMTYGMIITPTQNPMTLLQVMAGSNSQLVVSLTSIMPLGAQPAEAPLEFDWALQDTAGTLSDDTAAIVKNSPGFAESINATILKGVVGQTEPTYIGGNPKTQYVMTLHQQTVRDVPPANPFREFIIPGGQRWGLRWLNSNYKPVRLQISFEE